MGDTEEHFEDVDENGAIEGFEPKFVDVEGTRTRYYDIGDEEDDTLVLVHGGNWSGLSNANTWSSSFEHLSEEFRVLAFDRIGCGMTDNPEDIEDYRYQTEIDHALTFLETMDLDTCHIAGSSRGAGLAVRMTVEEPDRFRTLVMLNSGTFGPPTGDKSFRRNRIFERYKPDEFEPTTPEYTRFRYEQYSHQTGNITEEFCRTNAYLRSRQKAREMAEIMEGNGLKEDWKETMREQMNEARQRIRNGVLTIPTLYVFGRNDLMVPLEMALAAFNLMAQENPHVRMRIINNCGHIIYREYPEEFSQTVIDFIDQWH